MAPAHETVLSCDIVVAAPLERVWHAWTTEEGVTAFFAPAAKIQPWIGGSYELYFDLAAEPGLQGSDGCKILAMQPMSFLSFTWKASAQFNELRRQHTTDSTALRLSHTGWGTGEHWAELYRYSELLGAEVLQDFDRSITHGPKQWPKIAHRQKKQWICIIRPSRPTFPGDATTDELQIVGEHFNYLKSLLTDGRLVLAGRTQVEQPSGYSIFEAETEDAAWAVVRADPAISAGVFVPELYPYSVAMSR
jgi:uncharacterized protein YndB with AHSA1/START domain/uncharacterized protein YciI